MTKRTKIEIRWPSGEWIESGETLRTPGQLRQPGAYLSIYGSTLPIQYDANTFTFYVERRAS